MHLEEIKKYWDKRAEAYSEKSRSELSTEMAELWTGKLCEYLPKNKTLNCLDIGCGPGFIGILLGKLGHRVTFCDYSENMLAQADQNATCAKIDYKIVKGDAQNPNFSEETFDIVVNRNLVWNLENPELAYLNWLRILKPDGKLIIFDGNHYLHNYNKTYMQLRENSEFQDVHTEEYMKGVNPAVMEEIALNLPLSKLERPYWDVEFFLKNKVASVVAKPIWKDFINESGEKKSIIEEFTICVVK